MQQDVGVAVADQMLVVRDLDAAQPQRPAAGEPMGVVSDTDSKTWRDSTPFSDSRYG
jgi:hypothetical protein